MPDSRKQQTEMKPFDNTNILIVGGAGVVGGNLTRMLLSEQNPLRILIVDNLLSAELDNVPKDPRVTFHEGSIADDTVLGRFGDELDYVFHLATYHGNQSSIYNPWQTTRTIP
jgi:nucleoside-diphosphate-sugar epimerase